MKKEYELIIPACYMTDDHQDKIMEILTINCIRLMNDLRSKGYGEPFKIDYSCMVSNAGRLSVHCYDEVIWR